MKSNVTCVVMLINRYVEREDVLLSEEILSLTYTE